MCLAVPTQIRCINGELAEVELGGVTRQVSLAMTPDAQVDDYVLVHAGYAISIVDEEEALETLHLLHEMEQMHAAESDST